MSNSQLEHLRSAFESVENMEKALAQSFAYKDKYPKETVICDMLIQTFSRQIQKKSREILDIYDDQEGFFRQENQVFSGQAFATEEQQHKAMQFQQQQVAGAMRHLGANGGAVGMKPDAWSNFYEKLGEVQSFHHKYNSGSLQAEHDNLDAEALFNRIMEEVLEECDKKFTAEEGNGKYVDLHFNYMEFLAIKKLRKLNVIKCDDYLTWLQNFDKLYLVPLYIKHGMTGSTKYEKYLVNLKDYLTAFFQKTQPLVDWQRIEDQTEVMFEQEWEQESLFGWEEVIKRIKGSQSQTATTSLPGAEKSALHCCACNKTFANDNVFQHHKKGKKHIKAVNEAAANGGAQPERKEESEFSQGEVEKLYRIARLETWVMRLKDLLGDVVFNTQNLVRKKQTRSYTEVIDEDPKERIFKGRGGVASDEEDEDEDRPKYNPKNLPMGWDGKPIPYWLYKLHGLGIEFKCEICGGASYWGRRAFERHFSEWRHAYGMKCLKIPNTVHFKDVTEIEHALRLHKKILQDNFENTFKPDFQEEFQDKSGNIFSRKEYIYLKRQGLIDQ